MPIYEYRCTACEHELEALRKISDPPLTECPSCQEDGLVKKVSAAAFRLKGGGWYETDFKSSNQKNLAGDNGKSENKTEPTKSDSAKSSDKPAAPAASTSSGAAA